MEPTLDKSQARLEMQPHDPDDPDPCAWSPIRRDTTTQTRLAGLVGATSQNRAMPYLGNFQSIFRLYYGTSSEISNGDCELSSLLSLCKKSKYRGFCCHTKKCFQEDALESSGDF